MPKRSSIVPAILTVMLGLLMGCANRASVKTEKLAKDIPIASSSEISNLIRQLDAEDFNAREKAQNELIRIGEKMIEKRNKAKDEGKDKAKLGIERFADELRAACKSDSPETKMRANKIRRHLYSLFQPRILFESYRDSHRNIYVMDSDGANQAGLTDKTGTDKSPAWSPDGSKIAFVSNSRICVMDADGKNRTGLTEKKTHDECPGWSPDGKKIFFHSYRGGNYEIYVMDADGKNPTDLTDSPAEEKYPVLSPDGKKIVFASWKDGNRELYVMPASPSGGDADGRNRIRLTDNSKDDYAPAWNPDSSKLAFISEQDGNPEIYVTDADGKNLKRLTKNYTSERHPAWSPDGTRIAFESWADGKEDIYVMDADGKDMKKLTENNTNDNSPAWSPDGKKIAFKSGRDICVMDSDGANQARLTDGIADNWFPLWRPVYLPEISILFAPEEKK